MLAYVELIQRKEKEIGCDVLTHQKWYETFLFFLYCKFLSSYFVAGAEPTTSTAFYRVYRLVLPALQLSAKTPPSTHSNPNAAE